MVARPVWSPALVGYVGGGVYRYPSRAPSGWFPLAPTEVYVPHHRYSPRYVQQYNGGNFNVIAPPHTVVLPADGDRRARRHNGPEQPQPTYRYAQRPDALTMVDQQPARDGRAVGPVRPQPVPAAVPIPVPMAVPVPNPGPRVAPVRPPVEQADDLLRRAQQYPQQPYRQSPQQPQQQRPAPVAPLSAPVPVAAPLPTARPPQMAPPPVPAAQPAPVYAEPRRPRPETDKEKDKDRYDSTPGQRRMER